MLSVSFLNSKLQLGNFCIRSWQKKNLEKKFVNLCLNVLKERIWTKQYANMYFKFGSKCRKRDLKLKQNLEWFFKERKTGFDIKLGHLKKRLSQKTLFS